MYRRLALSLVVPCLLSVSQLGAQQVTGRVLDQSSGQPVAAVQVFIAGSGIGALSQQNGRYLLLNVPPGTHTLTAERIGYRAVSEQITVTGASTVVQDFRLSEEALGLGEIIVTGTPGGTQRRAIGNSVVSVKAADITTKVGMSSMQDMLRGRSPGVQLTRAVGNLGTGSAIEIRGTGSFSLSTTPLIYVDGVRVNNSTTAGPRLSTENEGNVMNDFNPADIESIEIIKGPAAATLYGTEASAGVIQIITKRGSEGTPQFDASVRTGIHFLMNPAANMGPKWACAQSLQPPCREGQGLFTYNAYDETNYLIEQGYFPWPTEHLFQNGPIQNYNVSMRGGTPTVRYFVSGNYSDEEGMVWYNRNQATRARANLGFVLGSKFSLDVTSGYEEGKTRYMDHVPGDGGEWSDLQWGNGYCVKRLNPGATTCSDRLPGPFQEHMPSDVAKIESTREFSRFTGGATLNFTQGTWLTSRAIVGLDKGWDENVVLSPIESQLTSVYEATRTGEVIIDRPNNTNLSLDLSSTVRYSPLEGLGTASSIGAQYYYKRERSLGITGRGLASPLSTTVNQTPPSNAQLRYSSIENKSLGFYVQEELSWKDRLFVTGALRFDDNSAFGSELSPSMYPKMSATWTVSDEDFWNVDAITSLRIRGAWGKAGRQPNTFAGVNTFNTMSAPLGSVGLDPSSSGNTDVGPERSTELELGFDISFLDDRVAGEFSWYNRRTDDALLGIALPPSTGPGGSIQSNVGRLDAWGWEAGLRSKLYESRLVSVNLDLTGSHVMNEIKELGDFPGNASIKIGYPYPNLGARYWIREAAYDPTGPISDSWTPARRIRAFCDQGVPLGEGSKYGWLQGGPLVDCASKNAESLLHGPAFFTYRFSVSPSISLFNSAIQIHVLADGGYGKAGYDAGSGQWSQRYNNSYEAVTEDDPFFVAGDRYGSTLQIGGYYDADFWKLREAGVRFTLPEALVGRVGADRATLNFSGHELASLWVRQGWNLNGVVVPDPEEGQSNNQTGPSRWMVPPLTTLTAELRVDF
jgi:TonB-linked SusC/RagA family outer membrane protein